MSVLLIADINGNDSSVDQTSKALSAAKELGSVTILSFGSGIEELNNNLKLSVDPNIIIQPIDDYGIDGDFVESQAFAFLAIRSILKLPISFPETTGCNTPTLGGEIINFK
mgnify:CR=1 FL=1